jgi:kynurenine formamidase
MEPVTVRAGRLWDLSQPISHGGPAWFQFDPPVIERNYRREIEGFNAETVRMNTHTGTHVDVPYHFDDAGPTVDQMPVAAFAAPAVFLDLRAQLGLAQPIGEHVLQPLLGRLEAGDIAVLVTGWVSGARSATSTSDGGRTSTRAEPGRSLLGR